MESGACPGLPSETGAVDGGGRLTTAADVGAPSLGALEGGTASATEVGFSSPTDASCAAAGALLASSVVGEPAPGPMVSLRLGALVLRVGGGGGARLSGGFSAGTAAGWLLIFSVL